MLTTIEGYYDNGKIIMTEDAPVQSKTKVMITFLKDEDKQIIPKERVLDSLKGMIEISDDFDGPLDGPAPRKIVLGSLKGLIEISDDFNEPLDDLKDYM